MSSIKWTERYELQVHTAFEDEVLILKILFDYDVLWIEFSIKVLLTFKKALLPTFCAMGKNVTNLKTALLICDVLVLAFSFSNCY